MRHLSMAAVAAASAITLTQIATAADITPVYKAPPAAVVSPSGYYVWVDGMYDHVRLPAYSLGYHYATPFPAFNDAGNIQSFDPRLNGGGVRGAIGYVLPGSTVRFELGGSYTSASGSSSQTTAVAPYLAEQLLDGTIGAIFNCTSGVFICSQTGHLSTSYSAWQFNGKVAADWKYGSVTLTPSGAIFGGSSRAGQTLSQSFVQILGGSATMGAYAADTTLRWTDVGARVGLDISAPVTPALIVGLGGWVGFADRQTSLSGTDSAISDFLSSASAISTSASKGVFLANVEAGLAYKVTSAVTLRGFAGLNFDESVPGITHPSWTGSAADTTPTTPASIYYAHETSWYAGGGLMVRFGG